MLTYPEFHRFIIAAALSIARISGAFMICPVLSDSMIPGLVRRVTVFALAFVTFPYVQSTMPPGEVNVWAISFIAMKEVAIGFLIGYFSAFPFWVAENVGNFIDNQRGATMGEVFSPLNGAQVSTTGLFFTQIVSTLFFVGGAIFLLLTAIYTSFALWPVFGNGFLHMSSATPGIVLGSVDTLIRQMLIISAPVVIIMFLSTLGLGFVNRTAPQLNVFFLSMPVKSGLGLCFLIIYLPFIIDMLMYTNTDAILSPVKEILK